MDVVTSWRPHGCEDPFDQDVNSESECHHPPFPLWINLVQCIILLLMSTAVLQCVCQLLCIPLCGTGSTSSTASLSSPDSSLTRPLASSQRMLSIDEIDTVVETREDGNENDEKTEPRTKEEDDAPAPPTYTEVIQGPPPPNTTTT